MFKVKRSTYNNTTTFAINEYTLKKKKNLFESIS